MTDEPSKNRKFRCVVRIESTFFVEAPDHDSAEEKAKDKIDNIMGPGDAPYKIVGCESWKLL